MRRRGLGLGRRLVIGAPLVWLLAFFAAPFAIVAKMSLSQSALAQPPYAPVFTLADGLAGWFEKARQLSFDAYAFLLGDHIYADAYLSSLRLASIATVSTLILAYPIALAMARAPQRWRPILLALALAPFWTSFLIRVYAWIAILKDEGLLNHALMALGLIHAPLQIFATDAAVVIGIVYSYLPFMLLPLYVSLSRQDASLIDAASDLGATPLQAFWRITVPLSRSGALAGSLLVIIPAIGEFVIPDLLGGSETVMIGRSLWMEFFDNHDWPTAAALAITLLALLIAPLLLVERAQAARGEAA